MRTTLFARHNSCFTRRNGGGIGRLRLRVCPARRDQERADQLAQEAGGKGLVDSVARRLFVFRQVESAEELVDPARSIIRTGDHP